MATPSAHVCARRGRAHLVRAEARDAQYPQAPAFDTAATSSGDVPPAMPPRTIGWRISRSRVNRVARGPSDFATMTVSGD